MVESFREPGNIARTEWEYLTDFFDSDNAKEGERTAVAFNRVLNDLGGGGWELVSVVYLGVGQYRYFMKRILRP